MSAKELFCVVLRLAGLYMLLTAVGFLLTVILAGGASPDSFSMGGMSANGPLVGVFVIGVLGAGGIGFYLLRYAHRIARFAWAPSDAVGGDDPRSASPDPES